MCRQGVDTAVCWDGKSYVNKDKAGAWCTYKNVRVEKCDEHAPNPARMYACSSAAVGPSNQTPEPSKSSDAEKACETLLAKAKQSVAQNDRQSLAGIDAKLPRRLPAAMPVGARRRRRPAEARLPRRLQGGDRLRQRQAADPAPSTASPTPQPVVPTSKTDDKSCDDLLDAAHQRWAQVDGPGAIEAYKKGIALCPQRCDLLNELSGLYHALGDAAASQTWLNATKLCGEGKKPVIDNGADADADGDRQGQTGGDAAVQGHGLRRRDAMDGAGPQRLD